MTTTAKKPEIDETTIATLAKEQREAKGIEVKLEESRKRLEAQAAIDLEELAPRPVRVSVRDYKIIVLKDDEGNPLLDENDKPLKGREYFDRTVTVETYVSTETFFYIVALKKRFDVAIQTGVLSEEDGARFTTEQVLEVWKKTEPHMTYEHLREILDFNKIKGIFAHFFTS